MISKIKNYIRLAESFKEKAYVDKITLQTDNVGYFELISLIRWLIENCEYEVKNNKESYENTYKKTGRYWLITKWVTVPLGFQYKGTKSDQLQMLLNIIEKHSP